MGDNIYHIPALLRATIDILDIKKDGKYADATLGGGGHSRAILEHLGATGHLFTFDRDPEALANAPADSRVTAIHSNFRYMENFMRYYEVDCLDGILADLGVSFHHFDSAERGFSFRNDAPLDMRMNSNAAVSATDLIANADAESLTAIFSEYTDLRRPDKIANAILNERAIHDIDTTFRLAKAVEKVINPAKEKKELAQVFQALRIAVNDEMADLKAFLPTTLNMLKPGGVLAILTYHSLEDRIVKNFMKSGNVAGKIDKDFFGAVSTPWENLTKNGIKPDTEEIERNPRSRSARLRAVKLKTE